MTVEFACGIGTLTSCPRIAMLVCCNLAPRSHVDEMLGQALSYAQKLIVVTCFRFCLQMLGLTTQV